MVKAIKEFQKKGVIVKDVVCLVESQKFNARKKIKRLGFNLKSYIKHDL
jgi:orotate phosphoribosyltransferase